MPREVTVSQVGEGQGHAGGLILNDLHAGGRVMLVRVGFQLDGISELPAVGQESGQLLNRAFGNAGLSGQFLLEGKHTESRGSSLVKKSHGGHNDEWKDPDQVPGPLHLANCHFNFVSFLKSNQPGAQEESNRAVIAPTPRQRTCLPPLPLPVPLP